MLSTTVFLALLAYYFVGVDEGMMSVFGKDDGGPRMGSTMRAICSDSPATEHQEPLVEFRIVLRAHWPV